MMGWTLGVGPFDFFDGVFLGMCILFLVAMFVCCDSVGRRPWR
jgi:hypothetical protein